MESVIVVPWGKNFLILYQYFREHLGTIADQGTFRVHYDHHLIPLNMMSAVSFAANNGQIIHQLLVIQALRPDRMLAMGQRVVGTILGENFMHDAEQGLNLASVVEHEV